MQITEALDYIRKALAYRLPPPSPNIHGWEHRVEHDVEYRLGGIKIRSRFKDFQAEGFHEGGLSQRELDDAVDDYAMQVLADFKQKEVGGIRPDFGIVDEGLPDLPTLPQVSRAIWLAHILNETPNGIPVRIVDRPREDE